jgi:hypothetical protein
MCQSTRCIQYPSPFIVNRNEVFEYLWVVDWYLCLVEK